MQTTSHQENQWFEIVKENHKGVVSIHEARFKDAVRHLSRGLVLCRSVISNQKYELSISDADEKTPRLLKKLDQCMASSSPKSPEECHMSKMHREVTTTEDEIRRLTYTYPIDVDYPSSCPSVQVSVDDVNTFSAIIIFNLALAHQLDPDASTKKLRSGASLYQCCLEMAEAIDADSTRTGFSSTTNLRAACLCNMAVINHLLADHDACGIFFEGLLTMIISMAATGHPNASRLNDRYPSLVLSLLFRGPYDHAAPAA